MLFGKKNKIENNKSVVDESNKSQVTQEDSVFSTGSFTLKALLSGKFQKIFTYIKNDLKSGYLALPKVRLIEFLNPMGELEEKKRLIVEVQNLTADIIIADDERNVIVVILIEPENRTAFFEKKLSYTKIICELVGVSFTVINEVVDIETNGVISKYLKED